VSNLSDQVFNNSIAYIYRHYSCIKCVMEDNYDTNSIKKLGERVNFAKLT